MNELSLSLDGTAEETAAGVEEWFGMRRVHMLAVEDAEGRLVGYGDVHAQTEARAKWWLDMRERPGRRDVVSLLVPELERLAARTAPAGALLRAVVHGENDTARPVLEAAGYRPIRSSYRMTIDLETQPAARVWPEGISVRASRGGEDDSRIYEAHMDSFADHWDFERQPFDEWAEWHVKSERDPSLWFLAEGDGLLAGICLARPDDSGEPDRGWIGVLGVRPAWRRRGLGLALLGHAFRTLYGRGLTTVGLGVDAESTTGAVRLYERAGMRVARRNDTLEKML